MDSPFTIEVTNAPTRRLKAGWSVVATPDRIVLNVRPWWKRWLAKIWPWYKPRTIEDDLADILAEELRKEVDAELIETLKLTPRDV